jgi:hypothetical protein
MTDAELLIGRWTMTTAEETRVADFAAGGLLTYSIVIHDRTLVLDLTWHLAGPEIVTDDAARSNEVRSGYFFPDADTLVMTYDGQAFTFRRDKLPR